MSGLGSGAQERLGGGVSGVDVLGQQAGSQVLAVREAEVRIPSLAIRDSMQEPERIVGMDVLQGTVVVCRANPKSHVHWQIPRTTTP